MEHQNRFKTLFEHHACIKIHNSIFLSSSTMNNYILSLLLLLEFTGLNSFYHLITFFFFCFVLFLFFCFFFST